MIALPTRSAVLMPTNGLQQFVYFIAWKSVVVATNEAETRLDVCTTYLHALKIRPSSQPVPPAHLASGSCK